MTDAPFIAEERASDSPFVERLWRSQSERGGLFTSTAAIHSEIVVSSYRGETCLTVRGPETGPTTADCPAEAQFFGIVLKLGTFMPHLLPRGLLDRRDVTLPGAGKRSFWLNGSVWQYPDFDNAEAFVDKLMRDSLLAYDHLVASVMRGRQPDLSERTVRRRFLTATGLTPRSIRQIKRARRALTLLQGGRPVIDTVHEAGYFDQPHLTRAFRRFIGWTPAEIVEKSPSLSI
jgi:hypothetical protein